MWLEYKKAIPPSNGKIYYYASNLANFNHWLQVKTGSDQTAPCLCISCFVVCVLQNTQRISSSQSAQPLGTPVVSVTTPSLAPQGLVYSSMPTSYNPAGKSGAGTQPPRLGLFALRCAGS